MAANLQYPLKAIFGGTFDPPHLGHLWPLLALLDAFDIQACEVIPSHIPAHKQPSGNAKHRLNMTHLLAQRDPRLTVNEIELQRSTPSYSADTLAVLNKHHPDQAICFIMGLDSFLNLNSWHEAHHILMRCHVMVMMRADDEDTFNRAALMNYLSAQPSGAISSELLPYLPTELKNLLPKQGYLFKQATQNAQNDNLIGILRSSTQGELVFFMNNKTDISSSEIRRAIAHGESVEHWLTPEVAAYIQANRLYI